MLEVCQLLSGAIDPRVLHCERSPYLFPKQSGDFSVLLSRPSGEEVAVSTCQRGLAHFDFIMNEDGYWYTKIDSEVLDESDRVYSPGL